MLITGLVLKLRGMVLQEPIVRLRGGRVESRGGMVLGGLDSLIQEKNKESMR